MDPERLRLPGSPVGQQPQSRMAASALMRLQKGAGNKAVTQAVARPAPPYIEIDGIGAIKIPAEGIALDRFREESQSRHGRWEQVTRSRIAPDGVSFALPAQSRDATLLRNLSQRSIADGDGKGVDGVLTLPPMHGVPRITRAPVSDLTVTKLEQGRSGQLQVTLAWGHIELPGWWHVPQHFERPIPRPGVDTGRRG